MYQGVEIPTELTKIGKFKSYFRKILMSTFGSVLLFLFSTIITSILIEEGPLTLEWISTNNNKSNIKDDPKFAIYSKALREDHLVHVISVLESLGYKRTMLQDWDLLWAHDYPYSNSQLQLNNLESYRIVNHIPGCGALTNKVDLCTTNLPFLPKAFRLPAQSKEFLSYSAQRPEVVFVQKHNEHRHIKIVSPSEINITSKDIFVQEFISNPFLVDGYKFDIGVYVVITSIDPLVAYIYVGDVLFRFCPVKYYPFNDKIIDKYVVGDDYLPIWEVPSLARYFNEFEGSMRGAFDAYLSDQKKDANLIWTQVEHIIRTTIQSKEDMWNRATKSYKWRNFFELMRFDLIIDDNLKVYLMEANMSPNLSSAHFKSNALLYEQVLYSVFNLVGIGSSIRRNSLKPDFPLVEEMLIADKNLASNLHKCAEHNCDKSCNSKACNLCLPCMSGSVYNILKRTYREHLHRTDMRRIIPKPIINPSDFDIDIEVQNMTTGNEILTRWFHGKCLYDISWCT